MVDSKTNHPADQSAQAPATFRPTRGPVAIVITTYNHSHFLADALNSALQQTESAAEIVVVDDGSSDNPASTVALYPQVRLLRQENQGLAAARNAGLAAIVSEKVVFLDADDRLLPRAIAAGLDCFDRTPDAAFVYGGHRRIDQSGRALGSDRYRAISSDAYGDFLVGNAVGMHATVMYDRRVLMEAGGFTRGLRRCEDYDLYLRLSRAYQVASYPDTVAEYRWHGGNMSADHADMLRWVLHVQGLQKVEASRQSVTAAKWSIGRRTWADYYALEMLADAQRNWRADRAAWPFVQLLWRAGCLAPQATGNWVHKLLRRRWRLLKQRAPRLGAVDFGDFDGVMPIDADFGFKRGTPIDRYYVEGFLQHHAADIRGRVLEIGDSAYSRRFGGDRIIQQDVLHISADVPSATITGDLSQAGLLPDSTFDCMVLTQTLHLIFDMPAAIAEVHRALKPGGIVLVTVPGVSSIDLGAWGSSWYWSLTRHSARRLFENAFGPEHVEVSAFGNVYAATAFLQGLALEEVNHRKLDIEDPSYPVIVTIRAQRKLPT